MERGRLLWCDMPGRVEAIRIAPEHEQLPEPVESIDVTDEGLPGDRYFGRGDITLVEAEALEAFTRGDRAFALSTPRSAARCSRAASG